MKVVRSLILLFIVFSWGACSSYYQIVNMEVLKPAVYSVPPHIASIALVNNSYPYRDSVAHVALLKDTVIVFDSLMVDAFPDTLLQSLSKELIRRKFFDTVHVDTTRYIKEGHGKPLQLLSAKQVNSICEKYKVQGILEVGAYSHKTTVRVEEVLPYSDFFSTMDLSGIAYWRLYDGTSGQVIHQTVQSDTLFWDGYGATVNKSTMSLPNIKPATLELAGYMGWKYADEIAPYWMPIQRKIFTSGNEYFIGAMEWVSRDNWGEAEKLWGYIYENGKPIEKARAAHNIAFSFEKKGDFPSAVKWAFESYKIYKGILSSMYVLEKNEAMRYYTELSVRKRDFNKLSKQIGGN